MVAAPAAVVAGAVEVGAAGADVVVPIPTVPAGAGEAGNVVAVRWAADDPPHPAATTNRPTARTAPRAALAPATDALAPATDALAPATDALAPATDALAPATDALAPATDRTVTIRTTRPP